MLIFECKDGFFLITCEELTLNGRKSLLDRLEPLLPERKENLKSKKKPLLYLFYCLDLFMINAQIKMKENEEEKIIGYSLDK